MCNMLILGTTFHSMKSVTETILLVIYNNRLAVNTYSLIHMLHCSVLCFEMRLSSINHSTDAKFIQQIAIVVYNLPEQPQIFYSKFRTKLYFSSEIVGPIAISLVEHVNIGIRSHMFIE